MNVLARRIEKLEGDEVKAKTVKFLWQEPGESRDECIRRHGYKPDEKNATFIMTSWIDAKL